MLEHRYFRGNVCINFERRERQLKLSVHQELNLLNFLEVHELRIHVNVKVVLRLVLLLHYADELLKRDLRGCRFLQY